MHFVPQQICMSASGFKASRFLSTRSSPSFEDDLRAINGQKFRLGCHRKPFYLSGLAFTFFGTWDCARERTEDWDLLLAPAMWMALFVSGRDPGISFGFKMQAALVISRCWGFANVFLLGHGVSNMVLKSFHTLPRRLKQKPHILLKRNPTEQQLFYQLFCQLAIEQYSGSSKSKVILSQ